MKAVFNIIAKIQCCPSGGCLRIYSAEDGSIVVQGYQLSAKEKKLLSCSLPAGEEAVRIPAELARDLVRHIAKQNTQ